VFFAGLAVMVGVIIDALRVEEDVRRYYVEDAFLSLGVYLAVWCVALVLWRCLGVFLAYRSQRQSAIDKLYRDVSEELKAGHVDEGTMLRIRAEHPDWSEERCHIAYIQARVYALLRGRPHIALPEDQSWRHK
jgi:hypothetical protein